MNALMERLFGVVFLDPWLLAVLLLVPLSLWLRRRQGAPAVRFGPAGFVGLGAQSASAGRDARLPGPAQGSLPRSFRMRFLRLPRVLQVLALVLAGIALARPVHRAELPFEARGIDILLCLDTSSSMVSTDMDRRRTRLDVAKEAAARFVDGRPADRIGLVCFARYADLRCPLTLDHRALKAILSEAAAVESDGPEDATAIGAAVARAAQVLRASTMASQVAILLTDGEENVATAEFPEEIAPVHAGQLCAELGVRVYTIAAGAGNPDRSGSLVPLDTRQVEDLARRTGGRFFEAQDAWAVAGVYAAIDELEKAPVEEPRYRIEERFLPFLAAAVALFLAGRFLGATVLEVLP